MATDNSKYGFNNPNAFQSKGSTSKFADNPDAMPLDAQESIRFGQDTRHRGRLVSWMMRVVGAWLVCVIILTAVNKVWHLGISDNVLMTLLATTTINVLGLSKIILNGLFGSRGSEARKFRNR